MLKHLMNSASLIAIAAFDKDADERAALRAKIADNAKVEAVSDAEKEAKDNDKDADEGDDNEGGDESGEEGDDEGEDEDEEGEEGEGKDDSKVKETEEQKAEREKQEKIVAKAQRKSDRMQARIDEATAKLRTAEAETARLKAQLEADPDKKLTAAEIDIRAKALADEALKAKEVERLEKEFDDKCIALRKDAIKVDKDFDDKIAGIAKDFGNIPSFMITAMSDLENGGEVLAYIANDDEEVERLYGISNAAKLVKELVLISLKLEEAKKPKKKQISKVKSIDPVKNNGRASQSTTLTEADAKNMPEYIRKRAAMREAQRKARGY